ncbi:MAG TPA: cysteine--tRNA ligase [Polyangiaceae bacterium]|nr:cysteine--tRNA ligase [Polyangiaceae bacterium]
MAVRLYNTLTRRVEELVPTEPGRVKLYCCGPTTYDAPHAGHARAALLPDLLVRRLRALGLEVTYVRNITDVDDKILNRAAQNGEPPLALSKRMADVYQAEMRTLGCLEPTHEPRVSEHIDDICALVKRLIDGGSAYEIELPGGKRDVYFSVRSFAEYGKLSRRRIDELMAGARVAEDERKHDPLDFALWKGAGAEDWAWDTPLGRGRPGWHIECSAMSAAYLGHGFDVHAGGMDLIFPHHENEIAQSEAACPGQGPFARIWMHNGFVNVDKEKMSKSLGNFVTVRDVLERNDAEGFRWFLLSAHYRGPIQFDSEKLSDGRVVFPGVDEAERRVDHVYAACERLRELAALEAAAPAKVPSELASYRAAAEKAESEGAAALDDDLNTPVALAALGELCRLANELGDLAQKRRKDAAFQGAAAAVARALLSAIERSANGLGLLQAAPEAYRERTKARRLALRRLSVAEVQEKVDARTRARQSKDFAEGDRLRDELAALSIALKDGANGTEWTISQ